MPATPALWVFSRLRPYVCDSVLMVALRRQRMSVRGVTGWDLRQFKWVPVRRSCAHSARTRSSSGEYEVCDLIGSVSVVIAGGY